MKGKHSEREIWGVGGGLKSLGGVIVEKRVMRKVEGQGGVDEGV